MSAASEQLSRVQLKYMEDGLTIFVVGASGDLAKKKTYPSLFALYCNQYLPENITICGYARSKKSDEEFRAQIKPYLEKSGQDPKLVDAFVNQLIYRSGNYDSVEDVSRVSKELSEREAAMKKEKVNRVFYFAVPPNVFVPVGKSIRQGAFTSNGWNRVIVEKPFGRDYESFMDLSKDISALFKEEELYRIDHYLGKEMVQNLLVLRFANSMFEPIWNSHHIKSVTITFKEDIGTQGRGGYFDNFGIIRDVLQNHLLQMLSLVAMEPPVRASGHDYSNYVRDEKVKVLKCIEPVTLDDTVLGQYLGDKSKGEDGYLEDPTVPDDSSTPTFATCVLRIKNQRWDGVPFILKAGKALNEKKGEIRIQFRSPPGADHMFPNVDIPANELVLRLQPSEAVYMKTNVKTPGLATACAASELDLSYHKRYAGVDMPDAYTRLLLDVLRGKQATFVRDDELAAAWKIFTPLLHKIEQEKIKPIPYAFGSRGPVESDELISKVGYEYHGGQYQWNDVSKL